MLRIQNEKNSHLGAPGLFYEILWAVEADKDVNATTWVPADWVDESAIADWNWWKENKDCFKIIERQSLGDLKLSTACIRHQITNRLALLFHAIVDGRWYAFQIHNIHIYI